MLPGVDARQGGQELHQGAQQGRPEGDVEDGHLDAAELLRRADLRGHRPRPGRSSTRTSRTRRRASAASASTSIAEEVRAAARARVRRRVRSADRELDAGGEYQWRRDGEFHLFNPDTVFKLQHATRSGQYAIFKEYTQLGRRPERAARHAARPVRAQAGGDAGADRRSRAGRDDPQAVRHRRDVVRLDQPGGARDAGHRDEPPRRQVEHRRGRRGSGALRARCRTATRGAARSSRWRRGGSASPASTSSTPTTCRSRWRRAPSPARADSCPGHKVYPWIAKVRLLDAGRRADLAAAAPRHLFDRGSRAADLRPEEREPAARAFT